MNAAASSSPVPQLDALTGIRGIAAWFVVLFHTRMSLVDLVPQGAITAIGKGYLAVDLFFMLSGFVMWLNYAPRLAERGFGELPHFWWRRFARIWPLHAAILAGLVAFALLLAATGRDTSNYPFAELPLHVLLVQNWGFTDALRWNHPAWSISTEMGAYLLFPVLVLGLPWRRLHLPALTGFAVLLCALIYLVFVGHGETSLGDDIPHLGLPRCLAEFALGMALCRMWQEIAARRLGAVVALIAGGAILAAGIALGLPEPAFVPAGLAALLLALACDTGPVARFLASKPLRWLGDASYSTYLAHFPIFVFYKLLFVDESLQLGWVGLAGYITLVLAASALLYRLLEKPSQRWLNAHPPPFVGRLSPAS